VWTPEGNEKCMKDGSKPKGGNEFGWEDIVHIEELYLFEYDAV
jgi:hypothetical protein